MRFKKTLYTLNIGFCLLLGTIAGDIVRADQDRMPIVTGEHWTKASEGEKKAFLVGVGTMLVAERAAQGNPPPPLSKSLIPTLATGLSPFTFVQVMQKIDAYYADNAAQLKRPVIEVIWYELAVPNAK